MIDFILGHLDYWIIFIIMTLGLYGMMFKRNLVKKLIGMSILQVSIILFYISGSVKGFATVPVVTEKIPPEDVSKYLNPLPPTLMLTAIVVGVATLGVAFALMAMIHKRYGTLEESDILEQGK